MNNSKSKLLTHGLQRLHRVGQKVAGVGVDLELDPLEPGGFADETDPDRLLRVARAGGVEHDLDLRAVDDFQNVVVLGVVFVDAGQRDGDEFRLRGGERLFHDLARSEFARAEEEAVGEPASADDEFFHDEISLCCNVRNFACNAASRRVLPS